jgi:hypothetical protein
MVTAQRNLQLEERRVRALLEDAEELERLAEAEPLRGEVLSVFHQRLRSVQAQAAALVEERRRRAG